MMRRSASFVLLLVLMAWPTVRLVAQSPNPANSYDGIDLLFIVDHSGSMGGTRYAASALYGEFGNDPNGWRFSLPQEALTFLDTFSAPAELESINVSVMAFGQNTEVLLDWITVGQGESGLPWEAVLDNALEALSALRFGFRNLGATHTRYAFQQARNVFDKAPSPSPGRRNYRAIVILTDGMPCEQFNPAFQVDNLLVCPNPVNNYRNLNASRAELQQLVAEMRRNHPETAVYVIGMDVQGDFWDRTQDLWQRVACETDPAACAEQASDPVRYQGVSTDRGAGLALNRALLDIFNRAAPLSVRAIPINPDGSFGLPPYLAFFRLSFYKDSPNVLGVRFTAPDGLSVGLDTRGADTVIQTHRIADPAPGTWRYQVDDPNRIISVIPSANAIAARVNAEVVFGRLQQGATAPLKLTITNESGAPLLVYPDYPLSVVAHIYDARDPSPERQRRLESLSLQADPSAIGIAQFIANWSPGTEIEGRIGVRVEVSYTSPGGGETVLIPEQPLAGHFEVIRTTVEWLGVTSEREDRPISLGGRLTSADGGDFGNLESLVVGARLRDIDGNQIIPDKPDGWQVLPPGLRGINEVVGQFIPQVAGNFQLEQAIGVVAPDGDFRPIFVQPVTNPLTVRPIRRLRLLMTRPQGGRQAAQKLSLVPPIFDFNVPIDVQVELRDQNDQPFSLAEVTGGQELVPQLTVNDTPLELREIGAG
ncbi:MAG: vWA domain-containing protein, partial [Anaerolineae bacterium]|nr:vWA domain-containing protein [Anaerolineae bacterium]